MYAPLMPLATQRDGGRPTPEFLPFLDDSEVARVARTDAAVLFSGPVHVRTLALKIHSRSGWRWGPFIAVDCSESEDVVEEQLFALLESDAAVVSDGPRPALLQPGTIFLHEVGRLSKTQQVRLRDLLEAMPLSGGRRGRRRIMASSSESLLTRVMNGSFDDRLFYRLNVHHFVMPGTRD